MLLGLWCQRWLSPFTLPPIIVNSYCIAIIDIIIVCLTLNTKTLNALPTHPYLPIWKGGGGGYIPFLDKLHHSFHFVRHQFYKFWPKKETSFKDLHKFLEPISVIRLPWNQAWDSNELGSNLVVIFSTELYFEKLVTPKKLNFKHFCWIHSLKTSSRCTFVY